MSLWPSLADDLLGSALKEGVKVNLRNPIYSEGVLKTENGGVIEGETLRLQARKIIYTKTKEKTQVEAEGSLIFEYGKNVFVGDSLVYDFNEKRGKATCGRSTISPWFFGGEVIELLPDGTIKITNGFITTDENSSPAWRIFLKCGCLQPNHQLTAKRISLQLKNSTLFMLPQFSINMDTILDSPIRCKIRWSRKDPNINFRFEFYETPTLSMVSIFDWRLNRGPGIGLESQYDSEDDLIHFKSINYIARDSSLEDPKERTRYRFAGLFEKRMDDDKLLVTLSYDKESDKLMASDYKDQGIDIYTAHRTLLKIHRQYDDLWIANIVTRVKINNFQTVKQELPTFYFTPHPFQVFNTRLISESQIKLSYLDFQYAQNTLHGPNFHSSRFEIQERLSLPFHLGPVDFITEAMGMGIYYGASPQHEPVWLKEAAVRAQAKCDFYQNFGSYKHVMTPYLHFLSIFPPSSSPNNHFIFDIHDGWFILSSLRFGLENLIFKKGADISQPFQADLYGIAFFRSENFIKLVPKVYTDISWLITPYLKVGLSYAWDFVSNVTDHLNLRCETTVSEDLAFALEYRHRSPFCWRKAVVDNFILDSFRTREELRHSPLSDRRETYLGHLFWRFYPTINLDFRIRYGCNRKKQPNYLEYQLDLTKRLPAHWNAGLSLQHRTDDKRLVFFINLDTERPTPCSLYPIYD